MAKPVRSIRRRSLFWLTAKLMEPALSSTFGKSAAGRVARVKRLRPALTTALPSSTRKLMLASSGNDLQMSISLRAGTVISPASAGSSRVIRPISSTSRSVPVNDSVFPSTTRRTLERTGRVCRRSTTPATSCRGFNRASRWMVNCIVFLRPRAGWQFAWHTLRWSVSVAGFCNLRGYPHQFHAILRSFVWRAAQLYDPVRQRHRRFRQAVVGQFLGQGHCHLTWPRNRARAPLGQNVRDLDLVVFGDGALNIVDADQLVLQCKKILERFANQLDGDIPSHEVGTGDHTLERTFQLTHVGADALGDKEGGIVGQIDARLLGLLHQDRDPRLQLRRFHRHGQSPAKTRFKALFQTVNFLGIAIAGQDDLLATFQQGIESMEEFLLRAFLLGKELDVID